jgi:hypothetical protein
LRNNRLIKMNMIRIIIFGAIISILTASCGRPECENTNEIFNKHAPESKEYQDELLKQLSQIDNSRLTYWMETYQENNSSEYISVNIQGNELCAKAILAIRDSKKGIERILKRNGEGYFGAELKGLKFTINQDGAKTEFVFQEVSNVID